MRKTTAGFKKIFLEIDHVAYAAAAESEKPETLDFFNWLSGEQDTPSKARKN